MPAPENPKVGGCYIWVISCLLFVFTISGAVFLLLYVTQPTSPATSWYAVIGASLVFLPWFFWLIMFLYRVISRLCGFRMDCFSPFGSGYHDGDDKNVTTTRSDVVSNNAAAALVPVAVNVNVTVGDVEGNTIESVDKKENENDNGNNGHIAKPTSPRRVHFGGVVILGEEDDANNVENQGSPRVLSRSSSSSSSSSRHSNDSETPLRFSMA